MRSALNGQKRWSLAPAVADTVLAGDALPPTTTLHGCLHGCLRAAPAPAVPAACFALRCTALVRPTQLGVLHSRSLKMAPYFLEFVGAHPEEVRLVSEINVRILSCNIHLEACTAIILPFGDFSVGVLGSSLPGNIGVSEPSSLGMVQKLQTPCRCPRSLAPCPPCHSRRAAPSVRARLGRSTRPSRNNGVKRPSRSPQYLVFVRRFCMGAASA